MLGAMETEKNEKRGIVHTIITNN